ncbi:protein of unknown function DUF434 [Methanococcus maripaludis C5]|uniref:DUF434 domain-containing protein n=1 Tax=Methanococcus maripaludis (strain C5 / ATCC BAA-1333) TaxID=402880 RepID=A4FZX0_METM5|nr:DUF434 domain-containing protein [Methanococcus maripaludis]ABO35754.1 protein of unknown function DUF434 [Methanococcus maripaludis C5]
MNPFFETYKDLKYLLNRNYRKKSALDFITNHYGLNSFERNFFGRCVFSDDHLEIVNKKRTDLTEISKSKSIAIDGFNVLITLDSLIDGVAIFCEDDVIRDLKYQKGYKLTEKSEETVEIILKSMLNLNLNNFDVYYDEQTSKSGEISKITRNLMEKYSISGEVILSKKVDFELKQYEFVATSDFHIIKNVIGFLDIPKIVSKNYNLEVKNFLEIIKKGKLDF